LRDFREMDSELQELITELGIITLEFLVLIEALVIKMNQTVRTQP